MTYAVAIGGIIGTYLLAWAVFGDRSLYPQWKRIAVGLVAVAMVVVFWTVHPQLFHGPFDGSSLADQWP